MTIPLRKIDLQLPQGAELTIRQAGNAFPAQGIYRNHIKRLLDIGAVLVSLPVVLPLVLFLAGLIALQGGRPFYGQMRVGQGGKTFRMWKLRSMVPDAERKFEEYLAADPLLRAEWDATQKLKHDPRITRLGRIMRKTSFDELPQLWNVLKGEMSIVGPRPFMPDQVSLYPGKAYYRLRPGLTGFWQVSVRNDSDFAERAGHDNRYEEALSLAVDMRLVLRTISVVVRCTGH
jgi:exopolysaccharide production protein ExoY